MIIGNKFRYLQEGLPTQVHARHPAGPNPTNDMILSMTIYKDMFYLARKHACDK